MRISRILFFTIKQMLKRPAIWFLLLIMPAICFGIHSFSFGNENNTITALFYLDKDNNQMIYDVLTDYDGLVTFKYIDSPDELRQKIKLGKAECGYIFDENAMENFYEGKFSEMIELIQTENSSLSLVINEVLYSQIFPLISKHALKKYLSGDSAASPYYNKEFNDKKIDKLYDKYYSNGSTFHFEYDGAPDDYKINVSEVIISPMRGLLALFIFIASFAGALQFYRNASNPVFSINKIRVANILVPAGMTAISSYISLLISGIASEHIFTEAMILIAYTMLVTIFTFVFTKIIKKEAVLGWLLPFLILGSIIFTPIIIDISTFIPVVKYISFLFPTKYYLLMIALL